MHHMAADVFLPVSVKEVSGVQNSAESTTPATDNSWFQSLTLRMVQALVHIRMDHM